jgi:plastocyanin
MFKARFILGIMTAASLAGCGSDSTGTDTNPPGGRNLGANQISIVVGAQTKGTNAFTPNPLDVSLAASGLVTWFNDDATSSGAYGDTGITHNITADDGSFTSGLLPAGQSFRVPFSAAGTYAYHCSIHPTMKGTVTVTQ